MLSTAKQMLASGEVITLNMHKQHEFYLRHHQVVDATYSLDISDIATHAYKKAESEMYIMSPDYSIVEQSGEPYYDYINSAYYYRVFTAYKTPDDCYGAFISLYPLNAGGEIL